MQQSRGFKYPLFYAKKNKKKFRKIPYFLVFGKTLLYLLIYKQLKQQNNGNTNDKKTSSDNHQKV